jgi:uncharacterized protein YndB with AHSA1/START domain
MNPYGERLDKTTVRFERLLPGPIERVWQYITDGDKRAKWLAGGSTELAVDGVVNLEFHNASLSPLPDDPPPNKYCGLPEKMSFSGRVTRCDPPHLLAHTWEADGDYSEVEYVLSTVDDKVRIVITHTRLNEDEVLGVSGGWHAHLDILGDVLEGQTPRAFWKNHTALEAEYESRYGKADA